MFSIRGRVPEFNNVCFARWLPFSRRSVFIVGVFFVPLASAQPGAPLTLTEAEDIALANEPGQAAMLAAADALDEQAVAAGLLPDPTLLLGLHNFPIDSGGFSTEGMTQAQLGVRQVFTRGRARALGSERLKAMADERTKSAHARSRDVMSATRVAWLETYFWQAAHRIVSESRPFFEDLVNVTRSMYAVGRKSQHDVLRAELELSRLDDRLIEAGRARAESQAALSQWLGDDAYRPIAIRLPTWSRPPAKADLRRELGEHPRIAAAETTVQAMQSGVDLAKERSKPDWALDVAYGYREGFLPSGEPRSDFVSVSVSVDLPFFRKSRQDSELASALSRRRAAVATRKELHAKLQSELDLRYARWNDLNQRLALYENQILGQSKDQAQAALLAYQSDTGDFSDVMRGSIDDLNTRLEYIRLQIERAQSYAALANLGGIPR
ncbi:MAG: TolC family protein [Woeseiaceae bacterium]